MVCTIDLSFVYNKTLFISLACMLAPELNKLIKEQRLCENSIVKLEKVVHNLTSTGK
jgi:hypothetical protein